MQPADAVLSRVVRERAGALRVCAWPAFKNGSGNAYNQLLYEHVVRQGVAVDELDPRGLVAGRYDIWHLHWPENLLAPRRQALVLARLAVFAALVAGARARGTRLVWTAHNLGSHEGQHPRLERMLMDRLIPRLDGVIALSRSGAALASQRYPGLRRKATAIIPIGHYMHVYPNVVSRAEARSMLGVADEARMLLHLGLLRPYKNVPLLIEQFRRLADPTAVLVVAGQPYPPAYRQEIERAAAGSDRVQLHLTFIADDRLQIFLNAADLIVLPYREILNSSSAVLALSFQRPVLLPSRGALEDLSAQFGRRYVMTYPGELTAEALRRALDELSATPEAATDLKALVQQELDWSLIARRTVDFYQAVLT